MAELFDDVVALLESPPCARALVDRFRVESEQGAGNGAVLGVPVFIARLSDWVGDPSRAAAILQTLGRVDPALLHSPSTVIECGGYEPVGSELADTLLGPSRPKVASVIAGEAGIGERNADAMLPATGWLVLTAISARYGSNVDRKALKAALRREETDLLAGGWGQWLDATSNEMGLSSSPAAEPSTFDHWHEPTRLATTTPNDAVILGPLTGNNAVNGNDHGARNGSANGSGNTNGNWYDGNGRPAAYPPPVTRPSRSNGDRAAAADTGHQATGVGDIGVIPPATRSQRLPANLVPPPQRVNQTPDPSPSIAQPVNGLASSMTWPNSAPASAPASGGARTEPAAVPAPAPALTPAQDPHVLGANGDDDGDGLFGSQVDHKLGSIGRSESGPLVRPVDPNRSAGSLREAPSVVGERTPGHLSTTLDGALREKRRKPPPRKKKSRGLWYLLGLVVVAAALGGAYLLFGDELLDRDGLPGETVTVGEADDSDAAVSSGGDAAASEADSLPAGIDTVAVDVKMVDPLARSDASAVAQLRFQPATGEICHNVSAEGLGSTYQGRINVGAAGESGGTVVDFGTLANGDIGCAATDPSVVSAVLADLDGHYVELRDSADGAAIRAQLSDVMEDGADLAANGPADTPEPDVAEVELIFEPGGDGAFTLIEPGRIVLTGPVPSQAVADRLVAEFAAAETGLEVIDQTQVDPAAAQPTGMIRLTSQGLFQVSSAELADGLVVDQVAGLLAGRPDWTAEVVGHTDSTGNADANQQLSEDRAQSVVDRLVAGGVGADRLTATGVGSDQTIADDSTEEGRIQNRRIELLITLP